MPGSCLAPLRGSLLRFESDSAILRNRGLRVRKSLRVIFVNLLHLRWSVPLTRYPRKYKIRLGMNPVGF